MGIPGDTVAAIFLGALLIHGLTPGPQLFVEQGGLMYTIMINFMPLIIQRWRKQR